MTKRKEREATRFLVLEQKKKLPVPVPVGTTVLQHAQPLPHSAVYVHTLPSSMELGMDSGVSVLFVAPHLGFPAHDETH